jgi:hypothetical protein
MARDKIIIKASIVGELTGLGLSTSLTAIWNLIVDAVVSCIYIFECILDIFKADIEDKISKKRLGSLSWYIDKAKEFQLGDDIIFFPDGTIGYELIDEEKQIIAFATAVEAGDEVHIKVAKLVGEELTTLLNEELLAFKNYIEKIMIAGTSMVAISLPADLIKVEMNVYYDPIYSESDVQNYLDAALLAYKVDKQDSYFVINDFIEMLRATIGINDVEISLCQGIQGEITTDITRSYEVIAGYFNYHSSNVYTLIADD